MQTVLSRIAPLFVFSSALALTACASTPGSQSGTPSQPMMSGSGGGGMMGGASGGHMRMGPMDKDAMCAMYKQMQSARTPEERRAMMNERMPGMSPEMQQQHMLMMQQQCQ